MHKAREPGTEFEETLEDSFYPGTGFHPGLLSYQRGLDSLELCKRLAYSKS